MLDQLVVCSLKQPLSKDDLRDCLILYAAHSHAREHCGTNSGADYDIGISIQMGNKYATGTGICTRVIGGRVVKHLTIEST